ncbi:MAG: TIR domain-containing protein [Akkermansiaceae bacterium]|nr:TIR domain-containing protein [Akkermansiaceae bacterium]
MRAEAISGCQFITDHLHDRLFVMAVAPTSPAAVDFPYYAFISYSRKDAKAAAWLQKRLEWFPVPVKLVKNGVTTKRSRYLRPIYRDKTHLEIDSAHYWDNIRSAISGSRYLIVLCSPHSAQSGPVDKEVRHFLETHQGPAFVIPVILSGRITEDNEENCLCPALKELGEHITGRNLPQMVQEDDSSAADSWERGFIGIISYMLGVKRESLADHIRREERKRAARARKLAGVMLVLALAAVAGAVFSVIKTHQAEAAERRATNSARAEETAKKEAVAKNVEAALKAHGRAQQAFDKGEPRAGMAYLAEALRYTPDAPLIRLDSVNRLVHLVTLHPIPTVPPLKHAGRVAMVSFSPDGARVVTASIDGTARIWDAASGKPIGEPLRHESMVASASFSPDGSRIVTASLDKSARIWDAASGKPISEPLKHEDFVTSASFSPDGSRVVTASFDKTARIWDPTSGQPIGGSLNHEYSVSSASFSPDGSRILLTDHNGNTARIWDAASGKPISELLRHEYPVTGASFNPDGSHVVTASLDQDVLILDAASGETISEPIWHEYSVNSASFNPDGSRVVTASLDKTARIWDTASGKPISEPLSHEDSVNSASFSPDGSRVVTASLDRTARIWDAASGKPIGEPLRHKDSVTSAYFSPDGSRVVTASPDGTAQIWDAASGKPIGEPLRHKDSVTSAYFSPDGSRVVTASPDGTAHIWNVASGKPIGEPLKHEYSVNSASFSPDGSRVITASLDRTARIWDAASGKPIGEPLKHGSSITSASFSPDGSRVVTASLNGITRIWDTASSKPISEPLRHEDSVTSASFSPDGSRVVTASKDNTARIWNVEETEKIDTDTLHTLISLTSGMTISASGETKEIPISTLLDLLTRTKEEAGQSNDRHAALIRWLFSSPSSRTITPSSTVTAYEHVEREINWCFRHPSSEQRVHIIREAGNFVPNHPLLPFARASLETNTMRKEFLINYGEKRLPEDVELLEKVVGYLDTLEAAPGATLRVAERLLKFSPKSAAALRLKVWALGELNNSEAVIATYHELLALEEAETRDFTDGGYFASKMNRTDLVQQWFSLVAGTALEDESIPRTHGWALLNLGDAAGATAAFEKSRSLLPASSQSGQDLLAGLAIAAWLTDRRDEATAYYWDLIKTGNSAEKPTYWTKAETITAQGWPEVEIRPLEEIRKETLRRFPEAAEEQ